MKKIFLLLTSFTILSIVSGFAQADANAGKIWYDGNNLFINSPFKGVQVMDNSNPSRPAPVGFVAIPGNVDFAVFNNLMYANHFDDLVVFDWQVYIEESELVEVARFEGLFPQHQAPDQMMASMGIGMIDSRISQSRSQGGSMSCFSFDDPATPNYLYATNHSQINVVNVQKEDDPRFLQSVNVNGRQIETVFVEGDRLYLGMPDGTMIYSLDNPEAPQLEGQYRHMVGCDPVVAQGSRAYVTVRSGSTCNNTMPVNQLHIVNVDSAHRPVREGNYQLSNPHGLGVDGNLVFVCDGREGLKVLDVTNPQSVRLLGQSATEGVAYDLIVLPEKRHLIVVSGDHIIQYQYTATGQLKRLGEFKLDYS